MSLLTYQPFQFQYGTIKSAVRAAAQKLASELSIPVWYD